VEHLGLVEEVEHPKAGKLKFVGPAVSYTGLSKRPAKPPPLPGQHTNAILTELGYSQETVEELKREGVIKG